MNSVKLAVRSRVRLVAIWINQLFGDRITPTQVTVFGLVAHLPIAWLIAEQQFVIAGLLLIVFGLFDTLDGELARLQKRVSLFGAFVDSTADRAKEAMLYIGIGYVFAINQQPLLVALAIFTLGVSFLVSYINAAGDATSQQSAHVKSKANQTYRSGLGSFEVRISLLIFGLLLNAMTAALLIICLLGLHSIWIRTIKVKNHLRDA